MRRVATPARWQQFVAVILIAFAVDGWAASSTLPIPGTLSEEEAFNAPAPLPGQDALPTPVAEPAFKVVGEGVDTPLRNVEVVDSLPGGDTSGPAPLLQQPAGQAFLANLEDEYLGRIMDLEMPRAIAQAVLQYHFDNNRRMVYVQPVEADFERGEIRVLAIEARLERKEISGAEHFSTAWLESQLSAKEGGFIEHDQLVSDLAWINDNPFLRANTVFRPGSRPGTTALDVEVSDRIPVSTYLGLENTGTPQVGEVRALAGVSWGNAFGRGHRVSYQFSAPIEDAGAQPVHALVYRVPLEWRHYLTVVANYAESEVTLDDGSNTDFGGEIWQLSGRYEWPLGDQVGDFRQRLTFGVDYKNTNLAFSLGGEEVPTNRTAVVQFSAGYRANLRDASGQSTVSMNVVHSPGGLADRNTDDVFREVDPRLSSNYRFVTLLLSRTQRLAGNWSLLGSLNLQWANESLLSTEQIAIGGTGTVRGYRERVLFGDRGAVASVEVRMPPMLENNSLQLLAFADHGRVTTVQPLPGDVATETLSSVGAGLRFRPTNKASIIADIGFPLENPDLGFEVDDLYLNFSATYLF